MIIFTLIGTVAIVTGGVVMAFSAKRPSRVTAWASAYLVLIAGMVQLGLATAWRQMGQPDLAATLAGFIIFNLGNACVLLGTIYKSRLKNYLLAVNGGGLSLGLAMLLLVLASRHTHPSWALAGFIALTVIILISMPIGLVMSSRRKPEPAKITGTRAEQRKERGDY